MKALYLTRHFDRSEEIRLPVAERPVPTPREGECLVEVHASAVNPSDALGAIGYFAHAKLPRIPGRDFSGVVASGKHRGKLVWGTGGAMGIDFDGAHAEFTVIPESALALAPRNLSLLEAGVQTLPYVTAYYSLLRCHLQRGEKVLVIGALGQVGRAAMSLCRWKGARPIALVRGEAAMKTAAELKWDARDAFPDEPFDVILNTVGTAYWDMALHSLGHFGRMAIIAAPPTLREGSLNLFEFYRANRELHGINTVLIDAIESAKLLDAMKPGFESGELAPLHNEALFSLGEASAAYQRALGKNTGRIALKIKE